MVSETTAPKKPLFSGEPFEQIVAILIAGVTILASIVGYLQVEASARSNEALRDAQAAAIQAVGLKASGEVQSSAWTDLLRLREEILSLAIVAEEYDDLQAAERFNMIGERIRTLSPVLMPPYFDPDSGELPDQAAFEADEYLVKATLLSEQFEDRFTVQEAWGGKADTYIAHLTLLAVTLFLFGISITLPGRMRWAFLGLGSVFTLITLIWVLVVFLTPVSARPEAAMQAYAQGQGWTHQGEAEKAIEAFNQALAADPGYINAYTGRGYAYMDLAQYDQAAPDFEKVLAATERPSTDVLASLSWIYYLKGRFPDATRLAQTGIAQNPAEVIHHLDLALAQLAAGNLEAARTAYTAAQELATRQVAEARGAGQEPPASLWAQLDAAATDLDALLFCVEEQVCEDRSPAFEALATVDPAQGRSLSQQLRSLTVALEYTGAPPGPPSPAKIGVFEFAEPIYDEAGALADYEVSDTFTDAANEITFFFDYEGLKDGQLVVWKVFFDGEEEPSLRLVEEWSLGSSGEAEFTLTYGPLYTFSPGNFWVEMYVDSHLVQEGGFIIIEEGEASLPPGADVQGREATVF